MKGLGKVHICQLIVVVVVANPKYPTGGPKKSQPMFTA